MYPDHSHAIIAYQLMHTHFSMLCINKTFPPDIYHTVFIHYHRKCTCIYRIHNIKTEIIAASMRTPAYVVGAAKAGADIATIPYECMKKLFWHPMTDVSLDGFMSDWKKAMGDKKIL